MTDAWQGKGVGAALFKRMQEIAEARGLAGFSADVLVENRPMLRLFQKSGMTVTYTRDGATYAIDARFARGAEPDKTRG